LQGVFIHKVIIVNKYVIMGKNNIFLVRKNDPIESNAKFPYSINACMVPVKGMLKCISTGSFLEKAGKIVIW